MTADELFDKCWEEEKFGHPTNRKTLAYYAFIEGMQQVKNCVIPDVSGQSKQLKFFLAKLISEFDNNGEISWEVRDEAEIILKNFNCL